MSLATPTDTDEKAGAYALAAATIAGSLAAEGDTVFRTTEAFFAARTPDAADIVRSMFMDDEGGEALQ